MKVSSALAVAVAFLCTTAHAQTGASASTRAMAVTLDYDAATVSNLSGGIAQSSTYIGNLHLRGLFDLEQLVGWRDTRLFADGLWIHGGDPDAAPGDALGVNNLSAPRRAQIEELWLERNFDSDRFSVLGGLYDINTEFYRSQSGGLFLNSAFGIGTEFSQSGVEGPSIFPRTSIGVRFAYKPSANTVLRAAVLDGVPAIRPDGRVRAFEAGDGELYVVELAQLDRPGDGMRGNQRMRIGRNASLPPYEGKLAIGAWHYTTRLPRLDPGDARGAEAASGVYAIADRVVGHLGTDPDRAISVFGQFGLADQAVGRFARSASFGVVMAAPFSGRAADELGLAWAAAWNGQPYLRWAQATTNVSRTESAIELTYLAHLGSSFTLQPDLQYVAHPNTDRDVPDAWVFSLRVEFSFGS